MGLRFAHSSSGKPSNSAGPQSFLRGKAAAACDMKDTLTGFRQTDPMQPFYMPAGRMFTIPRHDQEVSRSTRAVRDASTCGPSSESRLFGLPHHECHHSENACVSLVQG